MNTPTQENQPLNAQVALITGGAQRIGACIAETLHSKGANVIIHYRTSSDAAKSLVAKLNAVRSNSADLVQADLVQTETLKNLIEQAHNKWHRLDILINNASSFYPTPMGEIGETDWTDLMGSNLKAPLFLSQAAIESLKETQGVIINMLDVHAERPMKNHPLYCVAKAGLAMLTKALAKELGPEIRVNGVAPGAILWPENEMNDETKKSILDRTFLKRTGNANDIAQTVLFLVANANYITGQIIAVDGGRSQNI